MPHNLNHAQPTLSPVSPRKNPAQLPIYYLCMFSPALNLATVLHIYDDTLFYSDTPKQTQNTQKCSSPYKKTFSCTRRTIQYPYRRVEPPQRPNRQRGIPGAHRQWRGMSSNVYQPRSRLCPPATRSGRAARKAGCPTFWLFKMASSALSASLLGCCARRQPSIR